MNAITRSIRDTTLSDRPSPGEYDRPDPRASRREKLDAIADRIDAIDPAADPSSLRDLLAEIRRDVRRLALLDE